MDIIATAVVIGVTPAVDVVATIYAAVTKTGIGCLRK